MLGGAAGAAGAAGAEAEAVSWIWKVRFMVEDRGKPALTAATSAMFFLETRRAYEREAGRVSAEHSARARRPRSINNSCF